MIDDTFRDGWRTHRPEALAGRVLRPDRAALADARVAVAEIVEPRDARIALARRGLVPSDWIDAQSRRFVVKARSSKARSRGQAAREHVAGYVVQAYPARVADAITIASSAAPVAVAEGNAREAAARIGVAPDVPVLWRVEARFRATALRWKRHGIGTDHVTWLAGEKGAIGMSLLEATRRALDPKGILNPVSYSADRPAMTSRVLAIAV